MAEFLSMISRMAVVEERTTTVEVIIFREYMSPYCRAISVNLQAAAVSPVITGEITGGQT
jgi:hypothetical protein